MDLDHLDDEDEGNTPSNTTEQSALEADGDLTDDMEHVPVDEDDPWADVLDDGINAGQPIVEEDDSEPDADEKLLHLDLSMARADLEHLSAAD